MSTALKSLKARLSLTHTHKCSEALFPLTGQFWPWRITQTANAVVTETTFIISAEWDATRRASNSGVRAQMSHDAPLKSSACFWIWYESTACLWSSIQNRRVEAVSQASECNASSIWELGKEAGGGAGSASDLPPCCWLPLFAHSVNYYQKAVYLGCSPMLLHILWPIIKGDLHYKPWSPSKKATVSAWRPIPALQHYQEHSLLICVPVLLRLSFLPLPSLGPLLPLC